MVSFKKHNNRHIPGTQVREQHLATLDRELGVSSLFVLITTFINTLRTISLLTWPLPFPLSPNKEKAKHLLANNQQPPTSCSKNYLSLSAQRCPPVWLQLQILLFVLLGWFYASSGKIKGKFPLFSVFSVNFSVVWPVYHCQLLI